jgi:hypothetical protein
LLRPVYHKGMTLHGTPEVEAKLDQLTSAMGGTRDAVPNELLSTQLDGLLETRATLGSRYDDIVSGRVQGLHGPSVLQEILAENEARRNAIGK